MVRPCTDELQEDNRGKIGQFENKTHLRASTNRSNETDSEKKNDEEKKKNNK